MSDPVIKGVKRTASRPSPQNASTGSSAKSRKPVAKTTVARPKPKRSAAEKAPVRKATPSKAAPAGTASNSARPSKKSQKQTKPTLPVRKSLKSGDPHTATVSSSKSTKKTAPARPAIKQSKKSGAVKEPVADKAATSTAKGRDAKQPLNKSSVAAKHPSRGSHQPAPRQPTRDEAAALKAFERAHKEFARGRFSEARMSFRALIEQHGGVAEVTARARTYLAIADARLRSENNLPRDAEALYDRGVIELNRGDYVAAQEMFERALKQDDKAADVHYALAAARARLGSIDSALQSLTRALDLKSNLRVRAQHDPDLAVLRNEPDFERLVFPASRL